MDQTAGTSLLARRGLGLDLVFGGVVFCFGAVFAVGGVTEAFRWELVVAVWFPGVNFLSALEVGLVAAALDSRASRRSRLLR